MSICLNSRQMLRSFRSRHFALRNSLPRFNFASLVLARALRADGKPETINW